MDILRATPKSLLQPSLLERSASTSPMPQSGTLSPQRHNFRRAIETNDERTLRKLLGQLEPNVRYRLVNSPMPSSIDIEGPMPRLPLSCAAAQGDVGNVLVLFTMGPAVGLLADEYDGGLQLTAAYWAAAYGQSDVLEALDAQGCAPVSQAVFACHQGTYVGVLQWACSHGATPAHFREALEMAIEAKPERLSDIDNLVREAGASLNVASTEAAHQSILYMAIARGHLPSARKLLSLGAHPDWTPMDLSQTTPSLGVSYNQDTLEDTQAPQHVIELAIKRGHLDLLPQLFACGARKNSAYFKTALACAQHAATAYIALLRCGVVPENDTEAAGLEKTCITNGQATLAGLISTQRIGLQLVARANGQKDKERERQQSIARERTEAHAQALLSGLDVDAAFPQGVSLFVADASMDAPANKARKQFRLAFNGKRPPIWDKLRLKIAAPKHASAHNEADEQALIVRMTGRSKRL